MAEWQNATDIFAKDKVNLLSPAGKCGSNFKSVISKLFLTD